MTQVDTKYMYIPMKGMEIMKAPSICFFVKRFIFCVPKYSLFMQVRGFRMPLTRFEYSFVGLGTGNQISRFVKVLYGWKNYVENFATPFISIYIIEINPS